MKKQYIFAFIIIIIAIGAIYSNTFDASWHYDDEINIGLNANIYLKEFTWENIKATWYAGGRKGEIYHPALYRPVAMFSFALNYYFGKMNIFGYHLVNNLIHLTTAIFLFLFLIQILNLPKLKDKYGQYAFPIALLATLFWAINPLQLQAVTYIVQRMASMAGMFYIMAMYFYLKGRTRKKVVYYGIAFIAGLFAIGAKENAIILPFSILLFDLLLIKEITRENIKIYLMAILWIVLFGILTIYALSGPETFSFDRLQLGYTRRDFTLIERLLTQPRVLLFYVGLLFYPLSHRLCLLHDIPASTNLFEPITTLLALIAISGILVLTIAKAKKWPLISYCVIFFLLNHLIEASIFPLELIYEHRNYLPSMLIFVPLAILLVKGVAYCQKPVRYALLAFTLGFLFTFGNATYIQNKIWNNEESLWLHNLSVNPTPRAWLNLGSSYYKKGDWVNMQKCWEKVVNYNEIYGTDYDTSSRRILPYGKVHYRAFQNLRMLGFINKIGGKETMDSFRKWKRRSANRSKYYGLK